MSLESQSYLNRIRSIVCPAGNEITAQRVNPVLVFLNRKDIRMPEVVVFLPSEYQKLNDTMHCPDCPFHGCRVVFTNKHV